MKRMGLALFLGTSVLFAVTVSHVDAQLILHAPFDADTIVNEEALDVSGNEFRGLVNGEVELVEGVAGEAVEFLCDCARAQTTQYRGSVSSSTGLERT